MSTVLDTVGAKAVDLARTAALAEAGEHGVGEHLSTSADGDRLVTHLFACQDPAYRGWRWSVTVARAPRTRTATVDEVVLVPGPDSIVAPEWLPFGERLRPDDLGVGDVIPTDPADDRLVPGYTGDGEPGDTLEPPWWEPGLGRTRVLSATGRDEAAERWGSGDRGPASPMAKFATSACSTCGWLLHLNGPLGLAFGVCANAMSPADARVVALDYGCGAHSENVIVTRPSTSEVVLDELGYEMVTFVVPDADLDEDEEPAAEAEPEAQAEAQAEATAPAAEAEAAPPAPESEPAAPEAAVEDIAAEPPTADTIETDAPQEETP